MIGLAGLFTNIAMPLYYKNMDIISTQFAIAHPITPAPITTISNSSFITGFNYFI
jgi:hypothetical protein